MWGICDGAGRFTNASLLYRSLLSFGRDLDVSWSDDFKSHP